MRETTSYSSFYTSMTLNTNVSQIRSTSERWLGISITSWKIIQKLNHIIWTLWSAFHWVITVTIYPMSSIVLRNSHVYFNLSSQQPCEIGVTLPILKMRKLRSKLEYTTYQGHTLTRLMQQELEPRTDWFHTILSPHEKGKIKMKTPVRVTMNRTQDWKVSCLVLNLHGTIGEWDFLYGLLGLDRIFSMLLDFKNELNYLGWRQKEV